MALDPTALKAWMQGRGRPEKKAPPKAKPKGPGLGDPGLDGEMSAEEMGDAVPNAAGTDPVWDGSAAAGVDPAQAEAFFGWMEKNEPDILDSIVNMATAINEASPQGESQSREELMWVEERGTSGDPEFDESQRKALGDILVDEMDVAAYPEPSTPEWKIAVAQAVAKVRAGEGGLELGGEDELPPVDDEDVGDHEFR